MATLRIAVALAGTMSCILAATTFPATSKAAPVAAWAHESRSFINDPYTPIADSPCDGEVYTWGSQIGFQWWWTLPENPYSYVWRDDIGHQVGTDGNTIALVGWTNQFPADPGNITIASGNRTWTVESVGSWGTSQRTQPCPFTILPP